MSFPGYKNSFSEEVTDGPRTNFSGLSGDDFLLNNTMEVTTKMNIKDGSFKLKNALKTKQDEGNVSYNITSAATLEHHCNKTNVSLRTKFKAKALEFQFDFPKLSIAKGNLNPYFRLGCSTGFTGLVPSAGWVYTMDNVKIHVRIMSFPTRELTLIEQTHQDF
jgi:hypothetical protein